jgi:hypothetical protein
MRTMNTGDLVTVHLGAPREKYWGVLLGVTPSGATLRGVTLDTYEDWVRQTAGAGPVLVGPVTVFFPAHRIERIELDESTGVVEGLGARFARVTGRDARGELLGGESEVAPSELQS